MDHEQKALYLVERTFPKVDEYRKRFQTASPPEPGSALAEDDLRGSPHQPLTEFARQSITAAWDHLDLVRLTVEARRLFPTGTNSALRGALVASAQAVWLLGPDDPTVRQQRGLTFAAEWYKRRIQFQSKYLKLLDGAEAERCEAQLGMLREHEEEAARLRTIREELQPTSAIREAARRVLPPQVQDHAELQWIRLGGDAHAIGWQLLLQETTWSTPGEGGLQEAQIGGRMSSLAEPYLAAWHFFEWAVRRFDDLSSAAREE